MRTQAPQLTADRMGRLAGEGVPTHQASPNVLDQVLGACGGGATSLGISWRGRYCVALTDHISVSLQTSVPRAAYGCCPPDAKLLVAQSAWHTSALLHGSPEDHEPSCGPATEPGHMRSPAQWGLCWDAPCAPAGSLSPAGLSRVSEREARGPSPHHSTAIRSAHEAGSSASRPGRASDAPSGLCFHRSAQRVCACITSTCT